MKKLTVSKAGECFVSTMGGRTTKPTAFTRQPSTVVREDGSTPGRTGNRPPTHINQEKSVLLGEFFFALNSSAVTTREIV